MQKIVIVGAGSFAREIVLLIERINSIEPKYELLGMIDDNEEALEGIRCNCPIIGRIENALPIPEAKYAMGIAAPSVKERIATDLVSRGFEFETLIDPSTFMGDYVSIGTGVIVTGFYIGSNVTIGNYVSIMGSMIGIDSMIGDYSTTTGYTNVAAGILGKRVFAGSNSVILNRVKVADDCTVGAGSVVYVNTKPNCTLIGNPAKGLPKKIAED